MRSAIVLIALTRKTDSDEMSHPLNYLVEPAARRRRRLGVVAMPASVVARGTYCTTQQYGQQNSNEREAKCGPSDADTLWQRSNVRLFKTVRRPPGAESTTNDQCCSVYRRVRSFAVNCVYTRTYPTVFVQFRQFSLLKYVKMADSGLKRNIPIKLGDFSVIDTEFSSIRERFDAEMRKMEEEMSKFRSELMNRESNNFFKSTTRYIFKLALCTRILVLIISNNKLFSLT